ncbi:hypothetical protein COCSADRAFT_31854 [Bipolaris sorokiniana ND90Pr]|uniref:Uncharacterized protein n=1 Tax=Cochliobolus sativus (strain ND90Pr / ATCC 201652) TaxID=665912 RepID=M2RRA6_COCSN|nr:uncharacterized protein COCSADRAFT_31854 [Bipolaris sorokiniana ND90Pr]EMD69084.1 hypothetical protein COCSADRAFT_31854 [Bipolaris sorokiniana ND90Pr]
MSTPPCVRSSCTAAHSARPSTTSRCPRRHRTVAQGVSGFGCVLVHFDLSAPHLLHSARNIVSKKSLRVRLVPWDEKGPAVEWRFTWMGL